MSSKERGTTGVPPDAEDADESVETADAPADAEQEADAGTTGEPADLSLDVVFEVLKNERRRLVLRFLKAQGGRVSLSDVAEHVAAVENDKAVDAISSDERKRVYVGLYQCHLPKMDDMGIVTFNRDRGRVQLREAAAQLDRYLDPVEEAEDRPWHRYYGAIAGVGLAVVAGVAAGVPPLAGAAPLALGTVVVAFGLCAGVHAVVAEDVAE